jgi:hypothetical protein
MQVPNSRHNLLSIFVAVTSREKAWFYQTR